MNEHLKPQKKSLSAEVLVEFDRRFAPISMSPDEFLWFLQEINLKQTSFARQVGCTSRTIYNERQREYVREEWAELIRNTVGLKRFRKLRKTCQTELNLRKQNSIPGT